MARVRQRRALKQLGHELGAARLVVLTDGQQRCRLQPDVGVALVCQLLFLLISTDPRRYRPIILIGVLEKLSFALSAPKRSLCTKRS